MECVQSSQSNLPTVWDPVPADVYNRTLPTGPLPTTTQTSHSCLLCTQMPDRRLDPDRHCLANMLCIVLLPLTPSADSQGYSRLHSASDLFLVQPGIHDLPALVGPVSPCVWSLSKITCRACPAALLMPPMTGLPRGGFHSCADVPCSQIQLSVDVSSFLTP